MAQHLTINQEEIHDMFFKQGMSKKEIKVKLFDFVPQKKYDEIWENLGLKGKKSSSFTYEIITKEEELLEDTSEENNSEENNIIVNQEYDQGRNQGV